MAQELITTPQGAYAPVIHDSALNAENLKRQVAIIREAMEAVMHKGHHYDTIPGCGDKPVLLKPGAEVIGLTFQFSASYDEQIMELGTEHREYRVTCTLTHRPTGGFVGQGLGSCSTKETKYRYRAGDGDISDIAVPKAYWDNRDTNKKKAMQALLQAARDGGLEGEKFTTKKDETGKWRIATFGERVEHDNPADYYNTCLKMAKKRAYNDAIITCTAASDVFTQDLEDDPPAFGGRPEPRRINMDSIRTTFNKCMTMEQLDKAVSDLGIDKAHPDAPAIASLYNETKALIESASDQEQF